MTGPAPGEENFARVGEDWDAEERARATLDRLGLEQVPLDRRIGELSGALRSYQGALIVASHDVPFLRELGLTRWLRLDGTLTEIDPL